MKIQGWVVERFGALREYEVRDLPAGLTVFCGPNGSGKSTLFSFLRQMMYGAAPANGGRLPFALGAWAGRLYFDGGDGVYTIARQSSEPSQVSVTRPDGTRGHESDVDRILGGANPRSMGALLAFDIADLQALPPLPAWVRERLFPAGSGRGIRSVQRALDALHLRKSAMEAAAVRDLQHLPTSPADLQARIERATRAAGRLCQLLQTQAQARLTLDLRATAIADLVAEHARYEALVDLSPVWEELAHARLELDSTEAVDEFPIESEQRLETALAARVAAQRTVSQLVNHERPARRQTAVAVEDPPNESVGAVVRQRVRLPEPASEDLSAWERRLNDAVAAAREAERGLETAEHAVRELETAHTEITTTLSRPEPPAVAVLDEEARLVQHVRTTLGALAVDQTATKKWQDQIAERTANVRALETQVVSIPSSVVVHLAWIAAVLAVAAGVWRFSLQDNAGAVAAIIVALVCAIGAAVQRRRRTSALDEDADRRNQLASARGELERSCQSLLHQEERSARRRFDISVDSVRLGLPPVPTDLQLKEREAELEAQRRQRNEWDEAQQKLAHSEAALAKGEEVRRHHMEAVAAAQAHERQTIQQWQQWKVHAGLTDTSAAGRAQTESVRTEAELVENCRRLRIQIAEWEQSATDWNSRARAALAEVEGTAPASVDRTGDDTDVEHAPAVQAARRRLRQCEDTLGRLFAESGVSDEAAFRARLATYRRRLSLTQTVRHCEARFNERVRREPAAEAIRREIPTGHIDEWRRRASQVASELTSVEASRDDVVRQLRQVEAEIAAATAESAELPVLETERAGLLAEAAATMRAARTLVVARSLLEDTRHHVERESQPAAFRRGSEALSAITFSRYERLGAAEDERSVAALDAKNGWRPVDQLSRGTVEQLYFSLRIGLAEDAAQNGAALPVMLDDVLDHFDPRRSQAMARQLIDLSRRHQVFVFTRRPETCELLRTLEPAARVVNMQEL